MVAIFVVLWKAPKLEAGLERQSDTFKRTG